MEWLGSSNVSVMSSDQRSLALLPHSQWKPAARPIARRNITSRSSGGDDIPFEDDVLPPPVDQEPARKTTITGSERAAFEKLYKTFKTPGRPENDNNHAGDLYRIADEYSADMEGIPSESLDKIFDEVLKGEPRPRGSRAIPQRIKVKSKRPGQDSQGDDTWKPAMPKAQSSRNKDAKEDAAKLEKMGLVERERVDKLIQNAPTDRALWQTLERDVFEKVRKLDLDNTMQAEKPGAKSQDTTKPDPPTSDARILFQNYPHHLLTALQTLRAEFPSSPLPLSILPAIKSLGRSSHALGATTTLYKHLIRCAWIQYSSYTYINTLLAEMDNGAIEFDSDILELLTTILKEHDLASQGRLGREIQMVFGMDTFLEGVKKVREWRGVVAERLGVTSEEKRVSERVVRRVVPEREKSWRGVNTRIHGRDAHKSTRPRTAFKAADKRFKRNDDRDHVPLVDGANPIPREPGKKSIQRDGLTDVNPFTDGESMGERHDRDSNGAAVESDRERPKEHGRNANLAEHAENPEKVLL
ncbi:hypothetical protein EJ02DRAFT_509225 [Clathrospora elynae]|uniref:Mtf2-like C-terminal domain-containing protein n=1 Tax=Clathrospora elynae TaxID=706981 RepID=A0A6A5T0S8_9PLEO|nr:hypothetical protein EJ02DRAFT_509225 [Clathrospora elynae]